MGIQERLALLTAKSPRMEPGTGGTPEVTSADIAAALGFAADHIPHAEEAIHLVLAKYCDDFISLAHLKELMPKRAWAMYAEFRLDVEVSFKAVRKTSHLALLEFCEAGSMKGETDVRMAGVIGISRDKWRTRYKLIYQRLLGVMYDLEGPAVIRIMRALGNK